MFRVCGCVRQREQTVEHTQGWLPRAYSICTYKLDVRRLASKLFTEVLRHVVDKILELDDEVGKSVVVAMRP